MTAVACKWALRLGSLLTIACPAIVQAQTYEVTPIVIAGDDAPSPVGGTYVLPNLSRFCSAVSGFGDFVFTSQIDGGSQPGGLFVQSETTASVVSLAGDSVTGTPIGAFTYDEILNCVSISDGRSVVFIAEQFGPGGTFRQGIFLDQGGADSLVVLDGQTAPGGEVLSIFGQPVLNDDVVVFGSNAGLLYSDGPGALAAVALSGDVAEGTGGGTYFGIGAPELSDSGALAAIGTLDGGLAEAGLFVGDITGISAVVLLGDPAPGTGGTFSNFRAWDINDDGDLAFAANIEGGSVGNGIFLLSGAVLTPIALAGQSAPETGGGVFNTLEDPHIGESGAIAYRASIDPAGEGPLLSNGVFVTSNSDTVAAALSDQLAPLGGQASITSLGGIGKGDEVFFQAAVTDDMNNFSHAIYTAPEPNVGRLALAAVLALLSLGTVRRQRS